MECAHDQGAGHRRAGAAPARSWPRPPAAAVDFIRRHLWRDGRLLATYKDGRAHLPAYLDDYAFLADALLELLQTRWRSSDLEFARQLVDVLLDQFEDAARRRIFLHRARSRATHSPQQDLQRRVDAVGQWRRGLGAVPPGIPARRITRIWRPPSAPCGRPGPSLQQYPQAHMSLVERAGGLSGAGANPDHSRRCRASRRTWAAQLGACTRRRA